MIEHLAIVESQVARLLTRVLRTAQTAGPLPSDPDQGPVIPSIDARRLLDRERALPATAGVLPNQRLTSDQAWRALEDSREKLRAVVLAADGLATGSIRAPHPFLGELNFHQWIAFIGFHEARHAAQVRATTASLVG